MDWIGLDADWNLVAHANERVSPTANTRLMGHQRNTQRQSTKMRSLSNSTVPAQALRSASKGPDELDSPTIRGLFASEDLEGL